MIRPELYREEMSPLARQLLEYTPSLLPLTEHLELAAAHDVTVLLTGETGTGKTHLARLIHDCSPRREQPLIVVPCGALAPNLVKSEFFGHSKGAFTGADADKVGKFEAAGWGTLLLDEIDALPLEAQAALLRVIETGEFEPVGSNETQLCRARIIAASNTNLEEAVARGMFRQDLFYRLNVMSFHLPPLRERPQDIASLASGMAARLGRKFGKGLTAIGAKALRALQQFSWPGNIRQLENVIQQAVLVSSGTQLLVRHLPAILRRKTRQARSSRVGFLPPHRANEEESLPRALAEYRAEGEREVIERALLDARYSRRQAACALGISRVTLYKKMKKYGLMRPSVRWSEFTSSGAG
jgi:two-component system, NtrC family, response regulator HydG